MVARDTGFLAIIKIKFAQCVWCITSEAATKGAFRVTHETHDLLFYPFLLFDEQQRQIIHHTLYAKLGMHPKSSDRLHQLDIKDNSISWIK